MQEVKRIIMKMINDFQENTEEQLNELRQSAQDIKEEFNKEMEILKKG